MLKNKLCVEADFSSAWYKKWSEKIGFPDSLHAKYWETSAICEALYEHGMFAAGKYGLGFGVGKEQIPAVAASYGAKILATDQDPTQSKAAQWTNGQLASNKDALYYKNIISKDKFNELVEYEPYDMNIYEKRYKNKFDFCWSNCVIGHLGSMEKSLQFLDRHAKYLKNGGVSVFTTELILSSFTETVSDNSDTIIWRLDDLYDMFARLEKVGLYTKSFEAKPGKSLNDRHITFPPYSNTVIFENATPKDVLKIPFANDAITQLILIFEKRDKAHVSHSIHRRKRPAEKRINKKRIQDHIKSNIDLQDYLTVYSEDIKTGHGLQLVSEQIQVAAKPGAEVIVKMRFNNTGGQTFFESGANLPRGVHPIVVSTTNPLNKENSMLYSNNWFSKNRPTVVFDNKHKKSIYPFHRLKQGEEAAFSFKIKAPTKPGKYSENFCIVLEGRDVLEGTNFQVNLNVTR